MSDLPRRVGQTVSVSGWVNTLRLLSKVQFVVVRDHTGMVQITHQRGGVGDEIEAALQGLTPESAVRITGRVTDNPIVRLGGLEIIPEKVDVLNRGLSEGLGN
ncbi:OB-fold nucleic acid binding domain-containing protein [Streptomyces sp. NBC_01340]|uniref:OB-fold nucleic acid binding domain-containing protein n=1 Tax=Streptomyces sp. NBC_01340 TaxID=2903830 RepID=UPI003DA1E81E